MKYIVKHLGIDFGSSNTVVTATLDGVKTPIVFNFKGSRLAFPTAILKDEGGEAKIYDLVGTPVSNKMKEDFSAGDRVAIGLVKEYFGLIKKRIEGAGDGIDSFDFSRLEKICFGHPAYFKSDSVEKYCGNMTKILSEVFRIDRKKIHGAPEPELAAHAYHAVGSSKSCYGVRTNENVLVLDFGGYTLDIVLMTLDKGGMKLVRGCGSVEASSISLGKEITLRLCEVLYNCDGAPFDYGVDEAKCELFGDDRYETNTVEKLYKYNLDGKKYTLSYRERLGDEYSACFTGSSSKSIEIEKIFSRLATYVQAFLQGSGVRGEEISHVLFTGGTARMAPLREQIMKNVCTGADALLMDSLQTESFGKIFSQPLEPTEARHPLSSELAVAYGALLAADGIISLKTAQAANGTGNCTDSCKHLSRQKQEYQRCRNLASTYDNRLHSIKKILADDEDSDAKLAKIKKELAGLNIH